MFNYYFVTYGKYAMLRCDECRCLMSRDLRSRGLVVLPVSADNR